MFCWRYILGNVFFILYELGLMVGIYTHYEFTYRAVYTHTYPESPTLCNVWQQMVVYVFICSKSYILGDLMLDYLYMSIKQDTVVKWMCNLVYHKVDWLM